ncbi:hypothetical protein [Methyloversatilis sp.]|uniref:hypothetical protein n=1 Tax=Methyloversatilis sp. TaxID=2569862 RepID=UPI0035B05DF7
MAVVKTQYADLDKQNLGDERIVNVGKPAVAKLNDEDAGTYGVVHATLEVTSANPTKKVYCGSITDVTYSGLGGFDEDGHLIATLNFSKLDASGQTLGLMIGTEGKTQVLSGNAEMMVTHLSSMPGIAVDSHVDIHIGCLSNCVNVDGEITHAVGFGYGPLRVSGTVENMVGLYVLPPIISDGFEGSGRVENLIGFAMPDIITGDIGSIITVSSKLTYESGKNKWHLFLNGDAPSYFGGPVLCGTALIDGTSALQVNGSAIQISETSEVLSIKSVVSGTPSGPLASTPPSFYIPVSIGGVGGVIPVWPRT